MRDRRRQCHPPPPAARTSRRHSPPIRRHPSSPDPSPACCRPLRPDDSASLQLLHRQLFPLDYDPEFFSAAVNGTCGVEGWAATACNAACDGGCNCNHAEARPHGHELVGFLTGAALPQRQQHGCSSDSMSDSSHRPQTWDPTRFPSVAARTFQALYGDPRDRRLLGLESASIDQEPLLYILTLGVAEVSCPVPLPCPPPCTTCASHLGGR